MNQPTRFTLYLLTVVLALPLSAVAREPGVLVDVDGHQDTQTRWLSVVMGGRKVGHARFDRLTTRDRVITRQVMSFEMGRDGVSVSMTTDETHEESADGQPLAFSNVSRISGLEMRMNGTRRPDGSFAVQSGAAGQLRDSVLAWPEGALLAWGMERQMRAASTAPGTRGTVVSFQSLMQMAVSIDYEIVGPVTLDMPQGRTDLIEVQQTMRFPGSTTESRAWMDADLVMQRMTMDIMGQTLELLACDRACAEAPNQPAEILLNALVSVPNKLQPDELSKPLVVGLRSELPISDWPGIDGQRLQSIGGNRYRLLTGDDRKQGDPVAAPSERDLQRTDWLNHDAPEVQALLKDVELDSDPARRMQQLQDLVNRHIADKNLRIGYASASDAARLRQGDCTEHAVLLAALGRAAEVPTRVVTGLAYTSDFGGKPSLVPHAWTAAWTGKHWQAFDAALPGDQLRLAMHADDGDPWRFYDGLNVLNQLEVTAVEVLDTGE